jgi:hypothetical protein
VADSSRLQRLVLSALWAAAAAALVIGAASARVIHAGEKEIALSTQGLKSGDAHAAAEHARRAAGWYAPGAPHVRVAYERLLALGTKAEGLGDRELALYAFRGVRTAALETRWLVIPHEEDLDRANRAIARIEAEAPRAPGLRPEPPQKIEREQLEALSRDEAPRTEWVVVLILSALLAGAGAALAALRGVAPAGAVSLRRAAPGLLLAAAGAAAWLLAIWRA